MADLEEKLDQAVALALGIPQANWKLMRKELRMLRGDLSVVEAA